MRRIGLSWLWLGVLVWLGCGPRVAGPTPVAGAGDEAAVWADSFSTEASAGPLLAGDAALPSLASALSESCAAAQLAPDGRLSQLAEALAQAVARQGGTPDAALVSFHAHRLGLLEPTPQLWLGNASAASAIEPALRAAVQAAGQSAEAARLTHCGGAAVRGGYGVVVVVAFVRRLVALEQPIPSHIERDDSLRFAGRLAPGYTHATLATTDPKGAVERQELGAGPVVARSLRFPAPGVYTLELLASGAEGVTVIAVFPLAVGVPVDKQRPDAGSGAVEREPEAVASRLLALIAAERKRRELPPLTPEPGLEQVALAHSTDMHEHHFVAHTSKYSGEANDRVQRAGLRTTLLLENIGRGYGAEEIHAGLMESPGHRANILHPDVRVVGVGVVAEAEGERTAFLATQLFARLSEPVNWPTAQRDLFEGISRQRRQQKRAGASLDAALSKAAQAAAERYARTPGANDQALLDAAMRGVKSLPKGATALSAALIKAEDLNQVAASTELLDPHLVALGLGVAPLQAGDSHALVVVLLLALGS
jgi:uncharacterized protein YkwD